MKKIFLFFILFFTGVHSFSVVPSKELRIGVSQEFETLHPMLSFMTVAQYAMEFVERPMLYMDPAGNWLPHLATSVPSLENGGAKIMTQEGIKKIEATWEIKPEAKWGDGVPVTCSDFAFSLELAKSPMISVPEKATYDVVEKISWLPESPKKCVFLYKDPKWNFYQIGRFNPVPRHLEEPIFKKYGSQKEGYEKNTLYVRKPATPGLYNGPYLVSELALGQHLILKPNKYFYGSAPKISKIIIKIIPNTGTLEANLLSGAINVSSPIGFTLDQALNFERRLKLEDGFKILYAPSSTYEHISINLDNPILSDLRVRRALMMAFDRGELNSALFEGKQQVANHMIVPSDPWFTEDPQTIKMYSYSSKEAQKLLEQAGWKIGKDGIRTKSGSRLSLEFATTAGNKVRETVQQYLKEKWKQVGIEVVIKNVPARVFFGDFLKKREFTGLAMFAWTQQPQMSPASYLQSKYIPGEVNSWSGRNVSGWKNKEVDQLLDGLELELSPIERKKMVQKVLTNYTNELPSIPLFYRTINVVIPSGLQRFALSPHSYSEVNTVENWSL